MDKLPDELIDNILQYAMMHNAPFDLTEAVRVAALVKQPGYVQSKVEDPYIRLNFKDETQQLGHLDIEESARRAFKEERLEKATKLRDPESEWPLYDLTLNIQRPHLLDWRLAGSVCHRFRRIGKIAFWTSKTFAMNVDTAKSLQDLGLKCLSIEDQQNAARYINSVVLTMPQLSSPSPYITLPRRIAAFPALRYLSFYLGERRDDPVLWMILVHQGRRMSPPADFVDALTSIGIPMEKLDVGIFINPSTTWSYQEALLKANVYPMLGLWASRLRARENKS